MNIRFADRVANLSPSAIREILKYTADPEVVPFSAGNPAPEAFPTESIAAITADIMRNRPVAALQYSLTEGLPSLRNRLKEYMRVRHKSFTDKDELIITAGAQQVMGLAAKVLVNEGDVILCETPSFIGSLNSFRAMNARLIGIPMEDDGMDMAALETALTAHPDARFIYTIPNFQNPTGITMSREKRRILLSLAKRFGVLILEDNPYGDLRYTGTHIPPVKSMDTEGHVLYAGSFSKVLAPGLRVGYAIGPSALIQKMVVAKQGEDVHTNVLAQLICDAFMEHYDFDAHIEGLCGLYRDKANTFTALIAHCLTPYGIVSTAVEGGLFTWCTLPDSTDMHDFCLRAVRDYKVAVVPGSAFLTDESQPCRHFRMNFSTPNAVQIAEGMRRLERMLQTNIPQGD